jgi:hypothetical protein
VVLREVASVIEALAEVAVVLVAAEMVPAQVAPVVTEVTRMHGLLSPSSEDS